MQVLLEDGGATDFGEVEGFGGEALEGPGELAEHQWRKDLADSHVKEVMGTLS